MAFDSDNITHCGSFNISEKQALVRAFNGVAAGTVIPTAAPAALTNSTGQVGNDTVAVVANIALATAGGNTYTDAAVNSAVNTAIATINADHADLTDKLNALRTALIATGALT